jgi:hypothetical protein
VAKVKNEHVAAQLIANLRAKIWRCAEDDYTARQAAGLCGEIEEVSRLRRLPLGENPSQGEDAEE